MGAPTVQAVKFQDLVWCKPSTEWCNLWQSILEPQLVLNCLAAGSQTLKGFGKVCQHLHYLCESAVQSDNIPCEASYGVSICLVMRLKRSPHLSRVCHSHQTSWREQFSCCMLETPFWKGTFWIDYPDLGAPHVEVVKFQDLVWCKPSTEWWKPLSILELQLDLNCLGAGSQTLMATCVNNCITSVSLQSRATIFHAKHLMGCPSAWSCG